jgi:hypothetical protein
MRTKKHFRKKSKCHNKTYHSKRHNKTYRKKKTYRKLKGGVIDPTFRTNLSQLVSTMPQQGHIGSYLNAVCSNSGYCIALGQNKQLINDYFEGFSNFKYAVSPMKRVSSGGNGYVDEIIYKRNNYKAICALKGALFQENDNLMYEAFVGQTFINDMCKYYPLFLETYGLYYMDEPSTIAQIKDSKTPFSTLPPDTSLYSILQPPDLYVVDPTDPDNFVDFGCNRPEQFCLLIEYLDSPKTMKQFILGYSTIPEFYTFNLPSILYQIYSVLASLENQFTHNDLHLENCLYYTIPDNKFITMNYHKKNGLVTSFNTIYIAKLIDYGRCFVFESQSFYDALCDEAVCNYYGDNVCGESFGFKWFIPNDKNDVRNYYISSLVYNFSHDLRLANEVRNKLSVPISTMLGSLMKDLVYDERYGTKSIPPDAPNPNGKVRNTREFFNNLDYLIRNDNKFKDANKTIYSSKQKLGDLHIYLDRSKPMEFILA